MKRVSASLMAAFGALAAAGPARATCSVGKMLELPVTMVGLQPLVSVQLDGRPTRLLVDSGAFFSTLSPGTAAEYGLRLAAAPAGFRLNGIGGATEARVATIERFGLGEVTIPRIQFLVGGSEVGRGAGLLGQNVLSRADMEYDLAHGAIRFLKAQGCGKANLAYWAKDQAVSELPIESIEQARYHTAGTILLNGQRTEAIFDTGAGTTILSLAAAARAGVKPDSPGVTRGGYSRGLGHRVVTTWIGPFASLKIGDEEIKNIRLRFGDIGEGSLNMLIGADFFLSHRVYVANSVHKLFFTYNGGPVFNLEVRRASAEAGDAPEPATADAAAPANDATMTAAELDRRGQGWAARRDFARAVPDLARAVQLAPGEASYHQHYALALLGGGRRPEGVAELDRAIALKPDDPDALLVRANLRLRGGERDGARADLDAVSRMVARPSDQRLELGALYGRLDAFDPAIAEYDQWIAVHPDDSRMAEALNGRCWTRALAGRDLDRAVADCTRALKARPHTATFLDSRGLARLRSGDAVGAIDDYDAALALNPKIGWSLYGRGLAKLRRGDKAGGDADLAAAAALAPRLADQAKRYGIAP